jgi:ribosomal protein L11 methyltransferase
MDYIELECIIEPFDASISEILVAELGEMGFESFVEMENGLQAYIRLDHYDENLVNSIDILGNTEYKISIKNKRIKEENWNETWEKNYFEPIVIDDRCVVRGSFHPEFPNIKYQITIDPKMAFGTGHHETTNLVVKEILEMEFKGKKVADLGCGTGILAILAALIGAEDITAIDIDEWSYQNTIENIELNQCNFIKVMIGDVSVLKNEKFDIIFANINKNVLLDEMSHYAGCMHNGSILLLSGFYQTDFEDINRKCIENGLSLLKQDTKNNWMVLKYHKPTN